MVQDSIGTDSPTAAAPPPGPGFAAFAVLALLGALVYGPGVVGAEFLNFDDPFYFDGPQAVPFHNGGLWGALTGVHANVWLPVSHVSLWLDHVLGGGSSAFAHVHALLLHVAAACALAVLFGRLGLGRLGATVGAAAFLLHPALVESVAWVASRKDVLSGLFVFAALVAIASPTRPGGRVPHAATLGVLALCSKATALVLPLLAVPVVLLTTTRGTRGRWHATLALAVVAFGLGAVHAWIAASEGTWAGGAGASTDLAARLAQVPGVFLHYVTTALWPARLNVLYPELATIDAFRAAIVPGLVVVVGWLVAIAVAVASRRPQAARCAAGLAWFALALAPFNTAFPASSIAAADRYLYLAVPGLALALVAFGRPGAVLTAVAAVALAVIAFRRVDDFRDSEALWRSSLAVDDANALAWFNRAQHGMATRAADLDGLRGWLERGAEAARYAEHRYRIEVALAEIAELQDRVEAAVLHAGHACDAAERIAGNATTVDAVRLDAWLRKARLARRDDQTAVAEAAFERARALAPEHPTVLAHEATLALAALEDESGKVDADDPRLEPIRGILERAGAAGPRDYDAQVATGRFAFATGELLAAERAYRQAIELDPRRSDAHVGRAMLFLAEGSFTGAEKAAREGLAQGVRDPVLSYCLGLALGGQGQLERARQWYEAYLRIRPTDATARTALAAVLSALTRRQMHELPPAVLRSNAERILELDPTNPKGFLALAVAERHEKRLAEAIVLLEKARAGLGDDDREVQRLLAECHRDRGWQLLLHETERRDRAMDHFRTFLALATPDLPTDAVERALATEWKRVLGDGQQALLADDFATAESRFRRCLTLRPDETAPGLQLGIVLLQQGGDERLTEAERVLRTTAEDQRARGRDIGLLVFYRLLALHRLDRADEAREIGEAFLAEPPATTPADVIERIRAVVAAAAGGGGGGGG